MQLLLLLRLQRQKVYPRVTVASASILLGWVVRNFRVEEGLSKMFCVVLSSLGHLHSQGSIVCGSPLHREYRGSAEKPRSLV